jgi:hypothetical protein
MGIHAGPDCEEEVTQKELEQMIQPVLVIHSQQQASFEPQGRSLRLEDLLAPCDIGSRFLSSVLKQLPWSFPLVETAGLRLAAQNAQLTVDKSGDKPFLTA